MKYAFAFALFASPAAAWEFTASPVCTLSHTTDAGALVVTYDPRLPQAYAIAVTRSDGWGAGDVFQILFDGPAPFPIGTNRQEVSGNTLTVRDSGFGNVLRGLRDGTFAIATYGAARLTVPLDGADAPLAAFESCSEGGLV